MILTEQLLTSPAGFGIATATPAQRATCRILDGAPLADLAAHPDVLALVGGPEGLARLELLDAPPVELVFLAAIRSAKTIIACAAALRMTQTVDVSRLGPGEVPRVSLVSLRLDTSAVAYRLLSETIRASRILSRLLVGEPTTEAITIRHPSGRPIEIACVAGAKAGAGLVARWSAGVVFDEAPRMSGADDSVVNLEHARSAILGRLLPGAQALYIGSPWAPHGPVYELVQEHWRKPSSGMVVIRGTGPMLNPTWWTPARCAALQDRDPTAYTTDVLGEFADPESGLLSPISVRSNTRQGPLELAPEPGAVYAAAVDPSEGGAKSNGFSLVVVQGVRLPTQPNEPSHAAVKFRVALTREFRGMRPEACWEQIAGICRSYGLRVATSDQYAASANADLAQRHGLQLRIEKATAASKLEDFTNLATLIHTDRVELSPCPTLRSDLLSVKKRVTQSGTTIVLPRTSDGRHADLASALCSALKQALLTVGRDLGRTQGVGFSLRNTRTRNDYQVALADNYPRGGR